MEHLSFFGPVGLIEILQQGTWDETGNFPDLLLGGDCLANEADKVCIVNYSVTVEDEAGKIFSIDGYCFPNMILGMKHGEPAWGENAIGDHILKREKDAENPCLYKFSVETMTRLYFAPR
jgi:hypothetical protein